MDNPASAIEELTGRLAGILDFTDARGLTDDALLLTTAALEGLGRMLASRQLAVVAELDDRSRQELAAEGLAARKGCRNVTELLERVTRASGETIAKRLRVARGTRDRVSFLGERLPSMFPSTASAIALGELGIDSAHTIVRGLGSIAAVVDPELLEAAEHALVAAATGTGPDSAVPCTADETKVHATVWAARLDQDGRMPREERALRMRSFGLGRERGGLVPVRGALLPDVAARFLTLLDAYTSPRTAPAFLDAEEQAAHDLERDPRSRAQQGHDIFAGILDSAARSAETPALGGAAPLVMVSVRQSDLDAERGVGFIDRVEAPVSMRTVQQYACNGGTQRVVLDDDGRIVELGSPQRCFTPQQRRAIALRDGECSVPGCHIPAAWCEIHHVDPAENGGPTHTDNGILLCWFHHRTLATSGWEFRMIRGAAHVKAPQWLDGSGRWRATAGSRVRRLDAVEKIPPRVPVPF
jgi:5-methylcytosine-specific restriction protein A